MTIYRNEGKKNFARMAYLLDNKYSLITDILQNNTLHNGIKVIKSQTKKETFILLDAARGNGPTEHSLKDCHYKMEMTLS